MASTFSTRGAKSGRIRVGPNERSCQIGTATVQFQRVIAAACLGEWPTQVRGTLLARLRPSSCGGDSCAHPRAARSVLACPFALAPVPASHTQPEGGAMDETENEERHLLGPPLKLPEEVWVTLEP